MAPLVVLLVCIHAVVAAWALVGLLEWFVAVPWAPITNPELPADLLVAHWLAMAATAAIFFVGLAFRLPATARLMVAAYVGLAAICAYETFAILTTAYRFHSMAAEYAAYLVLGAVLFWAPSVRRHFRLES